MNKIIDILKTALSLGAIEPKDGTRNQKSSKITNKILLKELVTHFSEQMEDLSVGKRLLYPMSFNILMHPDDYNRTKEALPFVLPEVVSAFYASIKRKRDAFNGELNYAPPATYWFFQFSACQIGERDGVDDFIKAGEIITTGSLTTFDIRKAQIGGGTRQETNYHLSVKCQNSNTNDNNINMNALLGMEIISDGAYTFNFDKTLNEDASRITADSNLLGGELATLRWAADNGNINVYDMHDPYIDISGITDTRTTNNIVKIQSNAVQISHVQIKYDQSTQTFYLAAYAKTRLNGREVPISSVGITPQWIVLPKFNSKIFINDSISVEFNANK